MMKRTVVLAFGLCLVLGSSSAVYANEFVIDTDSVAIEEEQAATDIPDREPIAEEPEDKPELQLEEELDGQTHGKLLSGVNNYAFGSEYSGWLYEQDSIWINFTLTEPSHVYTRFKTDDDGEEIDVIIYDNNEIEVSGNSRTKTTAQDSVGKQYLFEHSGDFPIGTYKLRLHEGWGDEHWIDGLVIDCEPLVSLTRPTITSLSSPTAGTVGVQVSEVQDALVYQYQLSYYSDFSTATIYEEPVSQIKRSGLNGGEYCYVRVRPYTVYNDGLKVYGNWSRAQAVYVKKYTNKVSISALSKKIKLTTLKKYGSDSFQIVADDIAFADFTYSIASIPTKAKKYVSINKNTGLMKVKKGISSGTYKIGIKVKAAATNTYNSAQATKTITLKIV